MGEEFVVKIGSDTSGLKEGFDVIERAMKEVITLSKEVEKDLRSMLEAARTSDGYGFDDEDLESFKIASKNLSLANKELKLLKNNLEEAKTADKEFERQLSKIHAIALKENKIYDRRAEEQQNAFNMVVKEQQMRLKTIAKTQMLARQAEMKASQFRKVEDVEPIVFREKVTGKALEEFKKLNPELKGINELYKTTTKVLEANAKGQTRMATRMSYSASTMKRFKMEMLSVMFFGMSLSRIWKEHISSLEELYGVTDMTAGAMQYLLMPAYEGWAELAYDLNNWIYGLDEGTRWWIGNAVIITTKVGEVLSTIGGAWLGIQGISGFFETLSHLNFSNMSTLSGDMTSISSTLRSIGGKTWNMAINFAMAGWTKVLQPALLFLSDKGFFDWTDKAWQLTVNIGHKLASGFSNFFSSSAQWLQGAVSTSVAFVMGKLDAALNGFMGLLGLGEGGWLRGAVGNLGVKISMIAGSIGTEVSNFFGKFGISGNAIWAAGGAFTMTLVMLPVLKDAFDFGKGVGNWIGDGIVESLIRLGIKDYAGKTGEEGVALYREQNWMKTLGDEFKTFVRTGGEFDQALIQTTSLAEDLKNAGDVWFRSYDAVKNRVILVNKNGIEFSIGMDKFKELWGAYDTKMTEVYDVMVKQGDMAYETSGDYNKKLAASASLAAQGYQMQIKMADGSIQAQSTINSKFKNQLTMLNTMLKTFGLPTFNIPGLAEGGIVTKPTLAMIGEKGPEAIIPLDSGSRMYGDITINVNANLNSSADARSLVDEVIRRLQRQLSSGVMI